MVWDAGPSTQLRIGALVTITLSDTVHATLRTSAGPQLAQLRIGALITIILLGTVHDAPVPVHCA